MTKLTWDLRSEPSRVINVILVSRIFLRDVSQKWIETVWPELSAIKIFWQCRINLRMNELLQIVLHSNLDESYIVATWWLQIDRFVIF
jgi:hypothetical protein